MSIEAMKLAIEAWDACGRYPDATSDIDRLDVAIKALRTAIQQAEAKQPATGEPPTETFVQQVPYHCDRIVWRGQYLHLPMNNPAPSVPADVVRDAERYRWLRENGIMGFTSAPGWLVTVAFAAMAAHAQTLDSNIDAAMLAAKDSK